MLQLFHLSVAKVDLHVGLLSEQERASAGAMSSSMWVGGAGRRSAGVEETGESSKWCERGGREAVWKRRGEAPVWKRRGRVIRTAWVAERKGAVQTRARDAELARASRDQGGAGTCVWTFGC
jgi:hypothetical protein